MNLTHDTRVFPGGSFEPHQSRPRTIFLLDGPHGVLRTTRFITTAKEIKSFFFFLILKRVYKKNLWLMFDWITDSNDSNRWKKPIKCLRCAHVNCAPKTCNVLHLIQTTQWYYYVHYDLSAQGVSRQAFWVTHYYDLFFYFLPKERYYGTRKHKYWLVRKKSFGSRCESSFFLRFLRLYNLSNWYISFKLWSENCKQSKIKYSKWTRVMGKVKEEDPFFPNLPPRNTTLL